MRQLIEFRKKNVHYIEKVWTLEETFLCNEVEINAFGNMTYNFTFLLQGRNNMFQAILLFLYSINKKDGMLG